MRTILHAAVLAAACLLLPACVPDSEQPLGRLADSQQETDLHGSWAFTEPNGKVQYLHIGGEPERPFDVTLIDPEPGLMRFWFLTYDAESGDVSNPFGMRFFTTTVGDDHYANCIYPYDANDQPTGPARYWFYKYRVDGDELHLHWMSFHAVGDAIEAGTLAGKTERDKDGKLTAAHLTATTDELVTYLTAGGDEVLFPADHHAVYHRQPTPPRAAR